MRFPSAFCRTVARVPSKTVASVLKRCDAWKNARCNSSAPDMTALSGHTPSGVARSRDVTCSYIVKLVMT